MFIVVAGKHDRQERCELDGTLDHVVPESHTKILERTVIVAVVNRKLMGIGPVIFAEPIGQAHVDGKFVGNAIVDFLDYAESTNVPIIVACTVAIVMVLVEQVLIAQSGLTLALGRHPGLARCANSRKDYPGKDK